MTSLSGLQTESLNFKFLQVCRAFSECSPLKRCSGASHKEAIRDRYRKLE